jgi:hypothetical protein
LHLHPQASQPYISGRLKAKLEHLFTPGAVTAVTGNNAVATGQKKKGGPKRPAKSLTEKGIFLPGKKNRPQ